MELVSNLETISPEIKPSPCWKARNDFVVQPFLPVESQYNPLSRKETLRAERKLSFIHFDLQYQTCLFQKLAVFLSSVYFLLVDVWRGEDRGY